MTVEERVHKDNSRSIVATECPFCDEPLKEQQGIGTHLKVCPEL